jgi:hypothetical protein
MDLTTNSAVVTDANKYVTWNQEHIDKTTAAPSTILYKYVKWWLTCISSDIWCVDWLCFWQNG